MNYVTHLLSISNMIIRGFHEFYIGKRHHGFGVINDKYNLIDNALRFTKFKD